MATFAFSMEDQQQRVLLCSTTLTIISKYRQTGSGMPESGGQLFGRLTTGGDLTICRATVPGAGDKRSIFSFVIDKIRGNMEIKKLFKHGYHYVGDWHTHPERQPTPSDTDLRSMQELFQKSKHQHNSFLMLILGTEDGAAGIWLSQHNDTEYRRLDCLGEVEHECDVTDPKHRRKRPYLNDRKQSQDSGQ